MEGDILTCKVTSNGYREPSYTWSGGDGVIISTSNTMTLSEGLFNLSCTVSGNFTSSCGATYRITGYAVGKKWPTNSLKTIS